VTGSKQKTYPFVEVHGAVQMDDGFFGQDATNIKQVGVIQNGADFRRTRLTANGGLTENMNYFVQMDFSFPGRPTFTDVWMEVQKLPILGNVRAGQWKQPFSLEVVSSFRYTTFAERSVLFQSFDPFRHIAIGFYDWTENEMMTWAASAYRAGQDQFGDALTYAGVGNYAFVGRVTGLAWYEDEGCRYLHLGGGYNWVAPQNNPSFNSTTGVSSFGTIPEYFIGQNTVVTTGTAGVAQPTSSIDGTPRFANTRNFAVEHYNLGGGELLWVEGPLSVQTEGMLLTATRTNGLGANFGGFYTTVGYFLTGEHRPYIKKSGAIDRIKVLNNFIKSSTDECWGLGAWELAARYSYIDLNSRDIQGGRLADFTAGLNWYLNSYAKVQFNYIRAELTNAAFGSGIANIYGLRAQFDF
jgi:phosphate-selective porin OprO/OprP